MPRIPLAVGALLLGGAAALAPTLNAQAPPAPPQPGESGADTLVQSKAAAQQARQDVFRRKGVEGRLTAMREIVRAHFRAPRRGNLSITGSEQLDRLDAEEVALFLSSLGYDPADLRSDARRAQGLVASATAVLFGNSTIEHAVAVSPIVVHARLREVAPADLGDGYRSTAAFEVVRAIKGDLAPGSALRIRQRSGPVSNGERIMISGEFQPGMSGEYLLFVSPEAYRLRARNAGDAPQVMTEILTPYAVVDGTAHATAPGQQSNGFAVGSLQ